MISAFILFSALIQFVAAVPMDPQFQSPNTHKTDADLFREFFGDLDFIPNQQQNQPAFQQQQQQQQQQHNHQLIDPTTTNLPEELDTFLTDELESQLLDEIRRERPTDPDPLLDSSLVTNMGIRAGQSGKKRSTESMLSNGSGDKRPRTSEIVSLRTSENNTPNSAKVIDYYLKMLEAALDFDFVYSSPIVWIQTYRQFLMTIATRLIQRISAIPNNRLRNKDTLAQFGRCMKNVFARTTLDINLQQRSSSIRAVTAPSTYSPVLHLLQFQLATTPVLVPLGKVSFSSMLSMNMFVSPSGLRIDFRMGNALLQKFIALPSSLTISPDFHFLIVYDKILNVSTINIYCKSSMETMKVPGKMKTVDIHSPGNSTKLQNAVLFASENANDSVLADLLIEAGVPLHPTFTKTLFNDISMMNMNTQQKVSAILDRMPSSWTDSFELGNCVQAIIGSQLTVSRRVTPYGDKPGQTQVRFC